MLYAKHLPKVIYIVQGGGLLLTHAKDAVNDQNLPSQLRAIMSYQSLIDLTKHCELTSNLTLSNAVNQVRNLQFDCDPCCIKNYIVKRFSGSDFENILDMSRGEISSAQYATKCPSHEPGCGTELFRFEKCFT